MYVVTRGDQTLTILPKDSVIFDHEKTNKIGFPLVRIFDYMVKENRSDLLTNITLVDTPGLNGSRKNEIPTYEAIKVCNALFWVMRLTGSATNDAIKQIKKIKEEKGDFPLYVVFTFADVVEHFDKAVSAAKKAFAKDKIKVEDFFFFGKDREMQAHFRFQVSTALKKAVHEHLQRPIAELYGVTSWLEKRLNLAKKALMEAHNKAEEETSTLLNDYIKARNVFVSEFNTSFKATQNMIDTYVHRCSKATLCNTTFRIMGQNLTTFSESFDRLNEADDKIKAEKLIEYGNVRTHMERLQYKIERITQILESVGSLKKVFK